MENKLTRMIYDSAPPLLQDAFSSVYGWRKNRGRFSQGYEKWRRFFEESHHWSQAELVSYQEEKLRELIRYCYDHVAYYQKLFSRLKLKPDDIRTLADLPKLPILEKEQVRRAGTSLISDLYDVDALHSHPTSGSTGTPLKIYWDPEMEHMEFASMWARRRPGMKRGDPCSTFTGLEIIKPLRRKPPFWRNNWAANQRMYSIFHISEANLEHYVKALCSRYSKFYAGYTSPVYMICDYMSRHGIRMERPPEAVFSASEELQPAYVEKIQEVLGCKVWNHYGLGELAACITEYACGHLHYDMDYSIIEFRPVGQEDGLIKAEIIGTNMHHKAWPLLRYHTGDMVLLDPNDDCDQTPGTVVRQVYGRTGHYYVLPDGSHVCNISVIAKKCHNVRLMQVVQERLGEITIRIVRDDGYTSESQREVEAQFRRKIGDEIDVGFEYVDDVERAPSGKYMSIINKIDN